MRVFEAVLTVRSGIFLAILGLALSSCSPAPESQRGDWGSIADNVVCADPTLEPVALKKQRRADRELLMVIRRGQADPIDEARKAIDAGDYRLAASVGGSAGSYAFYGAECRIPYDLDSRAMRVIGFDDGTDPKPDGRTARFGQVYNATILTDSGYPYGDICRPRAAKSTDGIDDQQGFGFPYEEKPGGPRTLGDAARSGSAWTVRRMLRANPEIIDQPDIFGMTPLAWAVAYRRMDAVEMLLRAKASPGGPKCQSVVDARSPMQVARYMQWKRMVQRFLPLISQAERDNLAERTAARPASLTEFNAVLIELNQRYADELQEGGPSNHSLLLDVDDHGNTTTCRLVPETRAPRFDAELCANAVLTLKWNPARNINGNPVRGETAISITGVGL